MTIEEFLTELEKAVANGQTSFELRGPSQIRAKGSCYCPILELKRLQIGLSCVADKSLPQYWRAPALASKNLLAGLVNGNAPRVGVGLGLSDKDAESIIVASDCFDADLLYQNERSLRERLLGLVS